MICDCGLVSHPGLQHIVCSTKAGEGKTSRDVHIPANIWRNSTFLSSHLSASPCRRPVVEYLTSSHVMAYAPSNFEIVMSHCALHSVTSRWDDREMGTAISCTECSQVCHCT